MHYVKAKGILSSKNGMNIYRGCLHGCIYCDARSACYQMNHDFEDIEVKENAVELLEAALKSRRKKCMIGTGAMTDPYMPIEKTLCNTRKCLELIDRYGFGAAVHTKSALVLRDIDILKSINNKSKAVVQMTLTTADDNLCKIIEPNVSVTSERYEALCSLKDEGIPTVVWLDPVLPFINDTKDNIARILDMCIKAQVKGIICFSMGVTLRTGNREYFYKKLDKFFPGIKQKYIDSYGSSYILDSPNNNMLMKYFYQVCKQNNIMSNPDEIFRYMGTFEDKYEQAQMSIFDYL